MDAGIIIALILLFLLLIFVTLFLFQVLVSIALPRIPYINTPKRTRDFIIGHIDFKKGERVIDLGCGNAMLLFDLEKQYGVEATGYEIQRVPMMIARFQKMVRGSRTTLLRKNLLDADLSKAETIFCYLGSNMMKTLELWFQQELPKGARVISLTFELPSKKPTKTLDVPMWIGYNSKLYMYQF